MELLAAGFLPTFRAIVIELVRRQLKTGEKGEIRFPLVGGDGHFDRYPAIANFEASGVRRKVGDNVESGFRQDLTVFIRDRDEIGRRDPLVAQPGSRKVSAVTAMDMTSVPAWVSGFRFHAH